MLAIMQTLASPNPSILAASLSAGGIVAIILGVILALTIVAVCFFVFKIQNNKKRLGDAEKDAKQILESTKSDAEKLKKEAIFEAKEETHRIRQDMDREIRDRRAEMTRQEQHAAQKEETLNRKENALDQKISDAESLKERNLQRERDLQRKEQLLEVEHDKIAAEFEKVAGLTRDEAKQQLMDAMEASAKKDAAVLIREIEQEARDEAEKRARNIVSLAVQRCCVDHSSELTVSTVSLPNDDMKGRIIGREGRNIRAIENATGIDLIIDDTPETIILSGFDPVRREIARISLEKLIQDGRIHPARIEEIIEKTRRDVENNIKETGEGAAYDTGVFNLHPEIIKLLGRLKYRTSYGQNVLKHSLEVSFLAGLMAEELGADFAICRRAGLLHDIGKAVDHEVEGTHISIGVDLAKRYKEAKEVLHCIAAHHNDVEPQTVEAVIIQAADAISGARPGARRESLENYVKRLEKLEGIANSFPGVEKSFAIQAGREVRIMVRPDQVTDDATVMMAKDIAKKIEQELEYPGQIKVNIIRELRTVEYAK